jgi:hypothetical protein
MSCNVQQKRWVPPSSVTVLSHRLYEWQIKNNRQLSTIVRQWIRAWAIVASNKRGKRFVERVDVDDLVKAASLLVPVKEEMKAMEKQANESI